MKATKSFMEISNCFSETLAKSTIGNVLNVLPRGVHIKRTKFKSNNKDQLSDSEFKKIWYNIFL